MEEWVKQFSNTAQIEDTNILKRLVSAKKAECTPLLVDKEKEKASFSGSHGSYEATLESCNCGDFIRRHSPCKHMIRLAIELGYIEETAQSNLKKVRRPVKGVSVEVLVERIETLPETAQKMYEDFLLNFIFRKKENVLLKNDDDVCHLVNAGLVEVVHDDRGMLESMTGIEIMNRLLLAGVAPAKKPRANADLVNWCLENVKDIPDIFSDYSLVTVSADTKKSIRKAYTYLRRKFDFETYITPDAEVVEFPAGATHEATVTMDGKIISSYTFPEDEITHLLDKYNCNRCKR